MVERGPEKAGVGGSIPSLGISIQRFASRSFERSAVWYRGCTSRSTAADSMRHVYNDMLSSTRGDPCVCYS